MFPGFPSRFQPFSMVFPRASLNISTVSLGISSVSLQCLQCFLFSIFRPSFDVRKRWAFGARNAPFPPKPEFLRIIAMKWRCVFDAVLRRIRKTGDQKFPYFDPRWKVSTPFIDNCKVWHFSSTILLDHFNLSWKWRNAVSEYTTCLKKILSLFYILKQYLRSMFHITLLLKVKESNKSTSSLVRYILILIFCQNILCKSLKKVVWNNFNVSKKLILQQNPT